MKNEVNYKHVGVIYSCDVYEIHFIILATPYDNIRFPIYPCFLHNHLTGRIRSEMQHWYAKNY